MATDNSGDNSNAWISRRGAKRTVPMQVLVLGMPRTGTLSMVAALEKLGYDGVYYMSECFLNPLDCDLWQEAIDAKWFGKGKPYGREEWDQLLGHCTAVTDFPAAAFPEELIAAYPEAKVILTTRDPNAWWRSISSTVGAMLSSRSMPVLARLDPPFLGRFLKMARSLWEGFFGAPYGDEANAKAGFKQQYDKVRALVPQDRLLEYHVGEGWDRLCAFLDKPVPQQPFPRVNDKASANDRLRGIMLGSMGRIAFNLVKITAPLLAVGAAMYAARSKR